MIKRLKEQWPRQGEHVFNVLCAEFPQFAEEFLLDRHLWMDLIKIIIFAKIIVTKIIMRSILFLRYIWLIISTLPAFFFSVSVFSKTAPLPYHAKSAQKVEKVFNKIAPLSHRGEKAMDGLQHIVAFDFARNLMSKSQKLVLDWKQLEMAQIRFLIRRMTEVVRKMMMKSTWP